MRCRSCGFNNIPGTVNCVRCQALLVASTDDGGQSYYPPRAGRMKHVLPLLYAFRGATAPVRNFLNKLSSRLRLPPSSFRLIPRKNVYTLLWGMIPGLGYFYTGRNGMAALTFSLAALLAFFWGNLLFCMPSLAGILLCLLLMLLFVSIYDSARLHHLGLTVPERLRILSRIMFYSTFLYGMICIALVMSTDWEVNRYPLPAYDLRHGEIVSLDRDVSDGHVPKPGDVVKCLYSEIVRPVQGEVNILFPQAEMNALVLAGPGAKITCMDGWLLVNGEPVDPKLFNSMIYENIPEKLDLIVPEGCYFCVNDVVPEIPRHYSRYTRNVFEWIWERWYIVPRGNIRAFVAGVRLPVWRWRNFEREE